MPAQGTLISVEEYLNTSYEGADREYVDGRIVERNLGASRTYAFPEQRVQVKATRDPRTRSGVTYSLHEATQAGLHTNNPDIELPVERLVE